MAKLPKRAAKEHKSHALRLRTYSRNLPIKAMNITEAKHRESYNARQGHTGKERDNALRKAFGTGYRSIKRDAQRGAILIGYDRDHNGVYVSEVMGI